MRRLFPPLLQIIFALSALAGDDAPVPAIGARTLPPADLVRLTARLKDADVEKACGAARELGDSRLPTAAPPLMTMYSEGDAERRMAAVKALGALPAWSKGKKPETFLNIALGDHSFAIRRQAARELAAAEGSEAAMNRFVAAAIDAKSHSALVRNRAIHHAAAVGGHLMRLGLIAFLRDMLAAPEDELAFAAVEELGELRDLSAVDALLKALASEREEFKSAVVASLEKLSGKAFHFDLLKWAEWRTQLRGDFGKDAPATSNDPVAALKSADEPRDKLPVDIIVAFDTTGSFLHVWPDVNKALDAVLGEMVRSEPSTRVGLIRYRSVDPRATLRYTLQPTPLTWNYGAIKRELAVASFGGGSGAMHAAMRYALNSMIWREHSRKIIVLIGDDTPVSPVEDALKTSQQLAHDMGVVDGVIVNTFYAKTTAGVENRQSYRLIAAAGIGRFYEYNKAEQHAVDMSAEKVDVKTPELPAETVRKWLTPRGK